MTEVRDWNKDMELCKEHEYLKKLCSGWEPKAHGQSVPLEDTEDILKYWLQQYTAEKERADKAEAREKKLREAIEEEVKCHILLGTYKRADELRELLASLYPKEEEA